VGVWQGAVTLGRCRLYVAAVYPTRRRSKHSQHPLWPCTQPFFPAAPGSGPLADCHDASQLTITSTCSQSAPKSTILLHSSASLRRSRLERAATAQALPARQRRRQHRRRQSPPQKARTVSVASAPLPPMLALPCKVAAEDGRTDGGGRAVSPLRAAGQRRGPHPGLFRSGTRVMGNRRRFDSATAMHAMPVVAATRRQLPNAGTS